MQERSLSTPSEYRSTDQSPVSEEIVDSTPADAALPPATSEELDTDQKPAQAPSESRSLDESPVAEPETCISNPAGGAESLASSGECDIILDSAQAPQVQSVGLTNPDPVAAAVAETIETASDVSDVDAALSSAATNSIESSSISDAAPSTAATNAIELSSMSDAAPSAAATNAIEPSSMCEVSSEGEIRYLHGRANPGFMYKVALFASCFAGIYNVESIV